MLRPIEATLIYLSEKNIYGGPNDLKHLPMMIGYWPNFSLGFYQFEVRPLDQLQMNLLKLSNFYLNEFFSKGHSVK
jgi:hypothetical protein